jgi:hypothetical protein
MEALKALMKDFNLAALIPDLSTVLGKVEAGMRLAVMVGPLVLLALGLLYLLAAPKEANYKLGYRFFWGMSSVESWRFTQRLAGAVWTLLGGVLTVVMLVSCGKFRDMEVNAMTYQAVKYILWELGSTVVSILLINLAVLICFTFKGIPRSFVPEWMYSPWRFLKKNKKQYKKQACCFLDNTPDFCINRTFWSVP